MRRCERTLYNCSAGTRARPRPSAMFTYAGVLDMLVLGLAAQYGERAAAALERLSHLCAAHPGVSDHIG